MSSRKNERKFSVLVFRLLTLIAIFHARGNLANLIRAEMRWKDGGKSNVNEGKYGQEKIKSTRTQEKNTTSSQINE